jgi:hypothetical protein
MTPEQVPADKPKRAPIHPLIRKAFFVTMGLAAGAWCKQLPEKYQAPCHALAKIVSIF